MAERSDSPPGIAQDARSRPEGAARRPLRIGINAHTIDGPFGGANRFAKNLVRGLQEAGHYVTTSLEPSLDAIFLIIAHNAARVTFTVEDIAGYKEAYPGTVVIQRINASDEQRGGNLGQNARILAANRIADHTVFVSEFMRSFWASRGIDDTENQTTILTGAEREIFHPEGGAIWDGTEPFRLVTHHWSSNFLKGFDVYQRFDEMLERDPWRGRFTFTYVGNIPAGFELKSTRHVPPADNEALADILRSHHGYLTAARLEPGGNHYIEAMLCGLPVLHLDHGSLPEYCAPYGITFCLVDFPDKLEEMCAQYETLRERVLKCPFGAEAMSATYVDLVERLVAGQPVTTRTSHPLSFRSYLARKQLTALRRRIGNRLAR